MNDEFEKIILMPYLDSKPWAGKILSSHFRSKDNIGEAWLVSTIKNKQSKLLDGTNLDEYIVKHLKKMGLNSLDEFPVLIKIIDAGDDLSIQVHPDDEYANSIGLKKGKFECWLILGQTTNKQIIYGMPDIDKNEFINKIKQKNFLDCVLYKNIQENDFIKVMPGTIHAILKNTLILEVQEPSDITFRLYDYDRKPTRQLHIHDAVECIFKSHPYVDETKYNVSLIDDEYVVKIKTFDKFYFTINRHTFKTCLYIKKEA